MKTNSEPAVLITGASTGIGEACALELDRLGWRVFAGVRNQQAASRLAEQASDRLVPVEIDVTNSTEIAAAARMLEETLGEDGLAGLVNNAGIVVPGPLEAIPIADIRRQVEVNFLGQLAVTQAMLPLLRRAAGRIVMMSSVSGQVAPPYLGAYAASKFALEAASDALRMELRTWKVKVSVVEPGSVVTPIWDKAKSTAEQLTDGISSDMMELYREDIDAFTRLANRLAAAGMPVQRVVDVVVHALTARRPKTRYPVGTQTKLAVSVFRLATDRMRDWIIRWQLGLR